MSEGPRSPAAVAALAMAPAGAACSAEGGGDDDPMERGESRAAAEEAGWPRSRKP